MTNFEYELILNGTSDSSQLTAAMEQDYEDTTAFPDISGNFSSYCDNITDVHLSRKCYDEYLSRYLGPRSLPWETLIPVTIIYVLIFVTGVFGNVTTCIVILTNQYMQTATNYYLFNLAMADMTTLIVGE
ncbi:Neuromedin-U receptor 1 [Orchesella cincta]|uniref:Neuromedin-U receptor 1 n=1 Tax=Orchesella cincta TaxID=48709 RepID=A0A1D2MWD2_ORCCI|nr:Neuromedin-U receptor 1 [Orchesella cincta]